MSRAYSSTVGTALWSVALLFFIQLFTVYVESIYRMSLIKLSMGMELLGILFMLAPLLVFILGRRRLGTVAILAASGLVVTRFVAVHVGASAQIGNAGIGVGCFLILLSYSFGCSAGIPRPNWTLTTIVAVLACVILRTAGATLDISMEHGSHWLVLAVAIIVFTVAWLLARIPTETGPSESRVENPSDDHLFKGYPWSTAWQGVTASILFFTGMALIVLFVSSPGIVSAWTGGSYWLAIKIALIVWFLALVDSDSSTKFGSSTATAMLLVPLVIGIFLSTTGFPSEPGAVSVVAGGNRLASGLVLFAIFNSPSLAGTLDLAFHSARTTSIRRAAACVFAGGCVLFALPLVLIFTNVWGYVEPVSEPLRNKFWLPFVIMAILMGGAFFALRKHPMSASVSYAKSCSGWAIALMISGTIAIVPLTTEERLALTGDASGSQQRELCVMTYNIQQGSEEGGDQKYLEQVKFIAGIGPDIVFLQESDTARPSGGNVDAPRLIAESLGYYLYHGPKTVTGTFGTAIVSRFPLEDTRTIFTYSNVDEVGTAVAEIEVGGRRITLFNNHPAGSEEVHHAHIDAMVAEARRYEHVIAGGDFNFRQTEPFYAKATELLTDTWLTLHPDAVGDAASILGGDTSDASRFDMTKRIDHVFVSPTFAVRDAQYVLAPESVTDHPAYWCVLRWD